MIIICRHLPNGLDNITTDISTNNNNYNDNNWHLFDYITITRKYADCLPQLESLLFCLILVACRPQLNRYQHIAVLENDAWEDSLPYEFKNPFYKTPRVRAALAESSWFGPGEIPVLERQAEKISRREIYKVLSHAGLLHKY
uniref:Uncharacterized protein n=1 Tax=Glossina palpalis gambiensis TaxID=67801 RepID=A0A1B0B8X2_9MUSC